VKYSFVIPCYNSEKSIGSVVKEIQDKMHDMSESSYEIILVNDYSKDQTEQVIFRLAEQPMVKAITLAKNAGQDSACLAGYRASCGDFVISLDDDGQTPANEVDKLISKLNEGYDVVIAHYPNKHHSGFRNWGSRVNDHMECSLLNKPKNLYIGSYFIARRFVINSITQYTNPYPYIRGLLLSTTSRIANVDVHHRSRAVGTSQYTIRKLVKLWMNGFTSFSIKPLRISTMIGFLFALFGFIFAIYAVVRKITHPEISAGWASLMAMLSLLGGAILIVMGITGEYIGRMYISMNRIPQYVIKEVRDHSEDSGEQR